MFFLVRAYQVTNEELLARIRNIYIESDERYFAPNIFGILKREGYTGSIERIQRIMKRAGIRSNITTETINEKWVADITCIHTLRDGWCYLASFLDLHTKKIVGYRFGHRMTLELVLDALDNVVADQKLAPGLNVHTDLGSQYTSDDFQKRLKKYEMVPSFSR